MPLLGEMIRASIWKCYVCFSFFDCLLKMLLVDAFGTHQCRCREVIAHMPRRCVDISIWRAASMRIPNLPNTQCALRSIKGLFCCPWSNVCCELDNRCLWVCAMYVDFSTRVFSYPGLTRCSMRHITACPSGVPAVGQDPICA